jgi:hypothetical protein
MRIPVGTILTSGPSGPGCVAPISDRYGNARI